jgi:hypothetical protein
VFLRHARQAGIHFAGLNFSGFLPSPECQVSAPIKHPGACFNYNYLELQIKFVTFA